MKNVVVGPRSSGRTEALLDLWLQHILDEPGTTSLFVTLNVIERDRIRDMLRTELSPPQHGILDWIVTFYELRDVESLRRLRRVRVFIDNVAELLEHQMGLPIEAAAVTVEEVTHHTGVGQKTMHVPFDKCKHCEEVAKQFGEIKGEELVPEFLK